MTPEQMEACAGQGQFWYMRADGTFYGTPERVDGDDMYLLDASPEWAAQWDSWEHAATVMQPLFDKLSKH